MGDDEFVVPEEPLEQERLHQRLIATARSLKKQKQRLKAAQDTLNDRWNEVLDAEEKHGGNHQTKSYPKRKLLPEFDDEFIIPEEPLEQERLHQRIIATARSLKKQKQRLKAA